MAASVDFAYMDKKKQVLPVKLSLIGLGGLVAILLMILATFAEIRNLKLNFNKTRILMTRVIVLFLFACCHVACSVYIIKFDQSSLLSLILSSCQLGIGAILSIVLVLVPPSCLFHRGGSNHYLNSKTCLS
jgi:1,3-beta-glucan synthase